MNHALCRGFCQEGVGHLHQVAEDLGEVAFTPRMLGVVQEQMG